MVLLSVRSTLIQHLLLAALVAGLRAGAMVALDAIKVNGLSVDMCQYPF
jgi:hypothetical protein